MKILLINEASGVHNYLKQGLISLGHEVTLATPSRGNPQQRSADLSFAVVGATKFHRLISIIDSHMKVRGLDGFDIANYINCMSLFSRSLNRYLDLDILKKSGALISYYGLGCDEAGLLRVRIDASDLPCESCMKYDELGRGCEKTILSRRSRAREYADRFNFSVSSAYVYAHCHDFFPLADQANIQLPIEALSLPFSPAVGRAKPIIVHSPTRRGFKGTHLILEAMSILGRRRSDFEFRIIENLSHERYMLAMRDCDIYIDQVHSGDAHGVAALENLAIGKIVVSGNGALNWRNFHFAKNAPIVRASSNPVVLADRLSDLLDKKEEFESIAHVGREYVLEHHNPVLVASLFLSLWQGRSDKSSQQQI